MQKCTVAALALGLRVVRHASMAKLLAEVLVGPVIESARLKEVLPRCQTSGRQQLLK